MRIFSILAMMVCMIAAPMPAGAQATTEVDGWKDFVLSSFTKGGEDLTQEDVDAHPSTRCLKLNNYGCVYQVGSGWNGSVGKDGAGHAAFSDPAYSVRAQIRLFCTWQKNYDIDTAMEIADRYTPWCDTLGSFGVRKGWGRSCTGGAQPPADFDGPLCKEPESGEPSAEQCAACNCPTPGARRLASAFTGEDGEPLGINEPLGLFNADGTINKANMTALLQKKISEEVGGLTPKAEFIERAIGLSGTCNPG